MRRPRSRYGSRVVSSEGYRWRRLNPMTNNPLLLPDLLAEIGRLRADNERLRATLQQIADDGRNCADHCRRQARRALEPKPTDKS